jgi:hypothetical protein
MSDAQARVGAGAAVTTVSAWAGRPRWNMRENRAAGVGGPAGAATAVADGIAG